MAALGTDTVSPHELLARLSSSAPPQLLDVRTPNEFETAHIAGAHNVPLDVVRTHAVQIAGRLRGDVVLVCRSGQRATQAAELLEDAGLETGSVLDGGLTGWEGQGFDVDRGAQHWEIERQVRLVAGSVVLTSVLGSIAIPKLKWLAAGIGAGLTYAAVSNTCAMGTVLSKLPYNRTASGDVAGIVARLENAGANGS